MRTKITNQTANLTSTPLNLLWSLVSRLCISLLLATGLSVIAAPTAVALTCAQGGPCALGDTGPGGGKIFYARPEGFSCGPNFTDTCHYLEVAPTGWFATISGSGTSADPLLTWSNHTPRMFVTSASSPYVSATANLSSSMIGLGHKLTQAQTAQDNQYYTFATYQYAPNSVDQYAGGSKTDWYLPVPAELNQLCKYARGQEWVSDTTQCSSSGSLSAGFTNQTYYSILSAITGADPNRYRVHSQNFSTGTIGQADKDGSAYVRPIRAFALPSVSTTSTIAVNSASYSYGETITISTTIQASGSTATGATGTVNFKSGGTTISGCGTVAVTSGIATCNTWKPIVGTYSDISAAYSGGMGFYASNTTVSASFSVAKATLAVIPDTKSLAFGSAIPTYSYTYQGFVNGENAASSSFTTGLSAPTCTNSTYSTTTSVAASPLTISCSGGSATNYTITTSGTSILSITRATPTISIALSAPTPTYGAVDTITATASVPGDVTFKIGITAITGCETVTTTVSAPYTAQCSWIPAAPLLSYSLNASLSPTNTIDYSTANSSTTSTPIASKPALTVTPNSGQSKVYGANNPVITYTITSGALVGSDVLSGALTYTGSNVGNYTIAIGTLANANYTITLATVTFAITQATQNAVSLSSLSSAFNPSNKTVALTGSGGSGTGSYTYSLDSSNTTVGCSVTGSTLTYTTAGTCIVAVTRAADTNHLARTDTVSFSIGLASQTITFGSLSAKNYSADTFTVSASSSASLTVVFTSGSTSVCTTSGANGAVITLLGVGTCVINANQVGDSNTSAASQVSQNFAVNPRAITITADAQTKVFGAIDPNFTYAVTSSSLLLGDVLTGSLTRAAGSDAGTYQIQAGTLTDANNPKYAITFVSRDLTISRATPTLVLSYPNSNVAILRPGATDTPTVTTSTSLGSLTFATSAPSSICTVNATSGVLSLFGVGSCPVVMATAQTTNYIQHFETTTVTVALLSTSLVGIPTANLTAMGGTFYASPVLTQTISVTSGSNGASVTIPANALDSTTAISLHLLSDASSQLALISGASSSVLSVVVSWVAPDGSVPDTTPGNPISVTLTNPAIKAGAKVYSVLGGVSTLVGTATVDGSVTSEIISDPVLVVVNPPVAPPVSAPVIDNSAAIKAAKDLADKKAAEEAEAVAALKAAQEKMEADAKALAEAKALADAAALKAAQEAADASAKAAALLQAEKDAALAAAKAADNIKPSVTLYSLSSKLKLNAYDTAYLTKYVKSLKNGASVTCIGYIYSKGTTVQKATALAKSQASAVCAQMKKVNKTLKTSIVTYPVSRAPKAATGAKWVGVSYRIDGFKTP
jgi:hypothetical protein